MNERSARRVRRTLSSGARRRRRPLRACGRRFSDQKLFPTSSILGHNLKRPLRPKRIDYGIRPPEIIFPREGGSRGIGNVGKGITLNRRSRRSRARRIRSTLLRWRGGAFAGPQNTVPVIFKIMNERSARRVRRALSSGARRRRRPLRVSARRLSDQVFSRVNRPSRVALRFQLFPISMHSGNLKRLVSEDQRLHHRPAPAHKRPIHPAVLLAPARQIMRFLVDAAIGLSHAHGPVVLAAHHDALDERLTAHVGFQRAVLGERTRKVAFLLRHVNPASLSGRGCRRSSCLRHISRERKRGQRP